MTWNARHFHLDVNPIVSTLYYTSTPHPTCFLVNSFVLCLLATCSHGSNTALQDRDDLKCKAFPPRRESNSVDSEALHIQHVFWWTTLALTPWVDCTHTVFIWLNSIVALNPILLAHWSVNWWSADPSCQSRALYADRGLACGLHIATTLLNLRN